MIGVRTKQEGFIVALLVVLIAGIIFGFTEREYIPLKPFVGTLCTQEGELLFSLGVAGVSRAGDTRTIANGSVCSTSSTMMRRSP